MSSLLHGIFQKLVINQMQAALGMLKYCIETCPDIDWNETHGDYPFSQVVFHTLFYEDYYLGKDSVPFKEQGFHVEHKAIFKDYEELEYKPATELYEKAFCLSYFEHCYTKVPISIEAETEEMLAGPSGISFKKFSRAELYVNNIRHIQHHAAQLGLRLQLQTGKEMDWIGG